MNFISQPSFPIDRKIYTQLLWWEKLINQLGKNPKGRWTWSSFRGSSTLHRHPGNDDNNGNEFHRRRVNLSVLGVGLAQLKSAPVRVLSRLQGLRAGVLFVVGERKEKEAEEEAVGVVFVNLKKPTKRSSSGWAPTPTTARTLFFLNNYLTDTKQKPLKFLKKK